VVGEPGHKVPGKTGVQTEGTGAGLGKRCWGRLQEEKVTAWLCHHFRHDHWTGPALNFSLYLCETEETQLMMEDLVAWQTIDEIIVTQELRQAKTENPNLQYKSPLT
jgi:hypothetical protein